ncbi:MAG: zinc-binding dehydrogenase [Actinomycetota bacterium]|nr:zinc-binding dehydrogenase [Actinomycetota bacterium]
MPKRLITTSPRRAALVDYEDPPLAPHQVRVKVEYASPKHGTELAKFRGEDPLAADYYNEDWRLFLHRDGEGSTNPEYMILGNQWVGMIIEKGPQVEDFDVGDRVCGYGGIQETQVIRAVDNPHLLKVPEGMSWKSAVCFDPAQFALAGLRDSHVRLGDRVAVFGLGAIGALAAQMATVAGAGYIAVVDPIAKRRGAALRVGADAAFDPASQDVGLELKRATNKVGVDVVIETSGNEQALQQALRGIAYGGSIAYVGWARRFGGILNLGQEAHFNDANIVFSRASSEPNRDHPRWNRRRIEEVCWSMLAASGVIDCQEIVDPVIPFAESPRGYQDFVDRHPERSVKLGVTFV